MKYSYVIVKETYIKGIKQDSDSELLGESFTNLRAAQMMSRHYAATLLAHLTKLKVEAYTKDLYNAEKSLKGGIRVYFKAYNNKPAFTQFRIYELEMQTLQMAKDYIKQTANFKGKKNENIFN